MLSANFGSAVQTQITISRKEIAGHATREINVLDGKTPFFFVCFDCALLINLKRVKLFGKLAFTRLKLRPKFFPF